MLLQEIVDEIRLLVKDPSFFDTALGESVPAAMVRRVNEAVLAACSQPGIVIPSLRKIGRFVTEVGSATVQMEDVPNNFAGKVLVVGDPKKKIKIFGSVDDMFVEYYPFETVGSVEAVCIAGNMVWYQGIPEVPETVVCMLQENPPQVADAEDEIPIIPEYLQRQIIVHGVASWLYDGIEDGVDGNKNNTTNSKLEFEKGIQKWREYLGSRRQHKTSSGWKS